MKLRERVSIDFFRQRLANVDALPQLALLGVATGLLTGLVILLFRSLIDLTLAWVLQGDPERFEAITWIERSTLTITGALLIGVLFQHLKPRERRVGVVHVMERLLLHQGFLPVKNIIVQFAGGVIALISGQSGGREGPAVHLGAFAASFLGQRFKVPNNSMRTLIACGSAAAIASSFNTPIAGVIFAMEVVMMEYTIASFIPVIIAAVFSTLVTHYFFGDATAFTVPPLSLNSLLEIPYVVVAGIIIGALAAGYVQLVQLFARLSDWPFFARMLLAGVITAIAAVFVPEIMGVGYDTVNGALLAQVSTLTLVSIVVLKYITSAASVGLGMPVGLIGPTLMIGAAVGGVFAYVGNEVTGASLSVGFYVMLGMTAMMGATLQAPLAALMAVLELTANPHIIMPAMLIIVVATMVSSQIFNTQSVFLATLKTLGLQYPPSPVKLHLQKAGVAAIMSRSFVRVAPVVSTEEAAEIVARKRRWVLIDDQDGNAHALLNPADLSAFLESRSERTRAAAQKEAAKDAAKDAAKGAAKDTKQDGKALADASVASAPSGKTDSAKSDDKDPRSAGTTATDRKESKKVDPNAIRLLDVPGLRMDVVSVDSRATVMQALEAMRAANTEACVVRRPAAPMIVPVIGVLTRRDIDDYREVIE